MSMEIEDDTLQRESVSTVAENNEGYPCPSPSKPSTGCEIPTRYVMAVLGFFGFVLNYMLRINMSIAIVAMVRRNSSIYGLSLGNLSTETNEHANLTEDGEFDWDDKVQSLITGSFFWGYVVTQIPGGRFAEIFGSKYIFGFSILLSGLTTILIPLVAEENPLKLICLRVLLGIFEGATYPSMHAMLARWAPPEERSRFTSIVYSGSQAGTVITLPLCGLIISAWGWRSSFYIMGSLPIFWAVLWVYFVFDSPETHPRISDEELAYLRKSLSASSTNSSAKVPWLRIATSLPNWAILMAGLASNWGFWTLLTLLPTYMKTMLGFDIKKNSLLSSIPYLTMWFFGVAYSLLADHFRSSGFLGITNVRKLSTFICLGLPACALFGVTFVGVATIPTLMLFTISVCFSGAKYSSYLSNHIDIAPNYAGTLLGIGNAVSTIPGWLAPLIAAGFTNGHQTLEQWHKVFYIATAIYILGFIFFMFFGSGEIQSWNDVSTTGPEVTSAVKDERKMSDLTTISSSVTWSSSSHTLQNENYTGRETE